MHKRYLKYSIIGGVILLVLALALIVSKPRSVKIVLYSLVLDNKEHFLLCKDLPTIEEVERVVLTHQDILENVIRQVKKQYSTEEAKFRWVRGAHQSGELHEETTPSWLTWGEGESCRGTGRGDIVFWYTSHSGRKIIENILGPTFFGIPYRGRNI